MTDRELNELLNQLPVLVIKDPLNATNHLGVTVVFDEIKEGEVDEKESY